MSKFRNYDNYEIYADGRIWSYSHKKWLKPWTRKDGYQQVFLYDNEGKMKRYYLHRIVYETFSGEPIPNNLQCNHINECKSDNRFCNINLMSPKQNINYGTRNSRDAKAKSKQVGAFKDGNLVMVFQSTREAQRQGFNSGHISSCCNGNAKTHKGYSWKYI